MDETNIARVERKPPPRLTIGDNYFYRQYKHTCGGRFVPPPSPVILIYYNPNYPNLCRVRFHNGLIKMVSIRSIELA